jgi:hypothetical protein
MSDMPSGPGARPNRRVRACPDSEGRDSAAAVSTAAPRFTGEPGALDAARALAAQIDNPALDRLVTSAA